MTDIALPEDAMTRHARIALRGRSGRALLVLLGCVVLATLWVCVPLWAQEPVAADAGQPLSWLSDLIRRHGVWLGLPAVFVGGLALNLTPCVYPMIPVTLAFFSSQAAGALRRITLLAFSYVLGISLTYALLGMLAAQTGALFGSWLQQPVVLTGIVAVVVALSLSMFGLYDLRVPQVLMNRLGRASAGPWGALLMGAAVGIVAAPCIGPFVLGLLLLVSQLGNPAQGFLLFFVLGLGMGLPYLVLGVAANRVSHLPKAGAWLIWSKKALGFALLGLALFFLQPLLPSRIVWWLGAGLLLVAGIYLGVLERSRGGARWFVRGKRLAGGVLVLAAAMIVWPQPQAAPGVTWTPYSETALEEAQRAQQPILIDIYADWCIPCVEMDHVTFRHPDVVRALATVATLRLDATREISEEGERLLTRYQIYGAPTMLLFDRSGEERRDLRLTGFMRPDEFLERLQHIL